MAETPATTDPLSSPAAVPSAVGPGWLTAIGWGHLTGMLRRPWPAFSLLLVGHIPFLWIYASWMWQYEHYRFLPFAVGVFAILWILRSDGSRFRWSRFSTLLVGADLLLTVTGSLLNSPWLVVIGLFCLLLAFLWASCDRGYQNRLAYLAVIPLLMIRLPMRLDLQLISWLQQVTIRAASLSLYWLGCFHCREGNVIRFADRSLFVEEACSGVQSLFTVLLLAAVIAAVCRRSVVHTLLLLASGVLWAGLMNVVRVTAIAVAHDSWSVDLTAGAAHDVLGYTVLALAIVLILGADQLLRFLLGPVDMEEEPYAEINPFCKLWNRHVAQPTLPYQPADADFPDRADGQLEPEVPKARRWRTQVTFCCVAMILMLMSQSLSLSVAFQNGRQEVFRSGARLTAFDRTTFDGAWDAMQLIDYEIEERSLRSELGQFSNVWTFQRDTATYTVACDYPFLSWHWLENCYIGQGWDLVDRTVVSDPAGEEADCVSVVFQRPAGGYAYLVYSLFDERGRPVPPAYLSHSVRNAVANRVGKSMSDGLSTMYQSQVFVRSSIAWSEDQQADLVNLHQTIRRRMRGAITGGRTKPATGEEGGPYVAEQIRR